MTERRSQVASRADVAPAAAAEPSECPGPSGDVPSDFQEGQWWLAKLDELAAYDDDGKRAVATVRNLMRTAHAQAPDPKRLDWKRELIAAGQAVIERWDTPLWKDAPHTAIFINRMRDAIDAARASAGEAQS